ncbi:MAG: UDP-3-O-(3-hydroxymyristoyl)glucosamine N-acyltransferase [Acidobacteriota bacterium]|jgi:UDP-3-O-[3-hydroxymyristoyl] glucosamine N-acyltransferase|nr:UDP-3-O-(3-hydroxymyristoyl)glucosamine N-acyltransferase [Acidobacteriota bacterium]
MKLSDIAKKLGCEMTGHDVEIARVAGIDEAGEGDLTFVSNRKYISRIKTTGASAIILGKDIPPVDIPSLRTDDPYFAFARALEIFFAPPVPEPGVHPTAVIGEDVILGAGVNIGAYAVIGRGCRIGDETTIYPHTVLYPDVVAGRNCAFHSQVTVREGCRIGDRVILQNGVVVGGDGFGFAPLKDGTFYKILQTGSVIIEDDVEIGANTAIDRAAIGDTIIRKGAKLDNLVQVGHGAEIGENSVLAAQAGLAGSTRLGRGVWVGGQAGFAGHLEAGDGAVIPAQSGTSHDIPAGAIVSGSPAFKNSDWLRSTVAFAKLPEIARRVRELEKELALLKSAISG